MAKVLVLLLLILLLTAAAVVSSEPRTGGDLPGSGLVGECPLPGVPTLQLPADGSKNLGAPWEFDWTYMPGATSNQIQIDADINFPNPVISVKTPISSFETSDLEDGTTYYWRVSACNVCGCGKWTAVWHFTTSCSVLEAPVLLSPFDGDMDLPFPTPLDWSDVSGGMAYHLQVDDDADFASPETEVTVALSEYISGGAMVGGTTYYWRVRVANNCGWSPWSERWSFTLGITTDVSDIGAPEAPREYALNRNYPNPFNPQTHVEFTLPRKSFVNVAVFDILGRRIRVLVNEEMTAGLKRVTWDGRDENGQEVSSGVYLCRMNAGGFSDARKMLLLR
jgi:hypothetical protein